MTPMTCAASETSQRAFFLSPRAGEDVGHPGKARGEFSWEPLKTFSGFIFLGFRGLGP